MLGSAIAGTAASGEQLVRYIQHMAAPADTVYRPVHAEAYEPLYQRYRALLTLFEQAEQR
jgi:ribulose kinase